MGQTALRALLYEVSITPKPGLVDRANTGAHRDMDFFTFVDSACTLLPYFRAFTLAGMGLAGQSFAGVPPQLRAIGLRAEAEMLAATGGVNTHKGLLFSMGLFCAALGILCRQGKSIDEAEIFLLCAALAKGAPAELEKKGGAQSGATYGQRAYISHRLTGVRGEAAAGFPHVRDVGLPALHAQLARGCSLNDAGAIALLYLMAAVDDTNLIGRAGMEGLRRVQREAAELTRRFGEPGGLLKAAAQWDRELIERGQSPGGSADLLALTLMAHWVAERGFWPETGL